MQSTEHGLALHLAFNGASAARHSPAAWATRRPSLAYSRRFLTIRGQNRRGQLGQVRIFGGILHRRHRTPVSSNRVYRFSIPLMLPVVLRC